MENHPEKGMMLMSKEKFYNKEIDQREKGEYGLSGGSLNSLSRNSSEGYKLFELLNDSRNR